MVILGPNPLWVRVLVIASSLVVVLTLSQDNPWDTWLPSSTEDLLEELVSLPCKSDYLSLEYEALVALHLVGSIVGSLRFISID